MAQVHAWQFPKSLLWKADAIMKDLPHAQNRYLLLPNNHEGLDEENGLSYTQSLSYYYEEEDDIDGEEAEEKFIQFLIDFSEKALSQYTFRARQIPVLHFGCMLRYGFKQKLQKLGFNHGEARKIAYANLADDPQLPLRPEYYCDFLEKE